MEGCVLVDNNAQSERNEQVLHNPPTTLSTNTRPNVLNILHDV